MDDEDWDDHEYDNGEPEDDDPEKEWVLDCGLEGCCMPGYHFRYECHTAEMYEAMVAELENEPATCNCHNSEGALLHLPDCPMRRR